MCNQLTLLAKASASRYIAQCEHGTIHVVWDNVSVRLRPEDFINIAENTSLHTQPWLARDAQQGFWLRLQGLALQFQPESLVILRDLMYVALMKMDNAIPTRSLPHHHPRLASVN